MTTETPVPGLWLLPVVIPIPALRTVNVYVFELDDGSIGLIDTGWDNGESWQSLVDGLHEIGRTVADVSVIAVTHAHPDHLGLARRIQDSSDARVFLYEEEHARLNSNATGPHTYVTAAKEAFPRWGISRKDLDDWLGTRAGVLARSWDLRTEPVRNGERLDFPGWDLRAVWTPGHSPGHMCLHEVGRQVLFTGDHVLCRITPGIGVHPADSGDPLADFLASLNLVAGLDVKLALPGHETPFHDVATRVEELHEHHRRRLREIAACVHSGNQPTTWEVASQLTWSRPLDDLAPAGRRLALTETQAHLVHLERSNTLICNRDPMTCVERWTAV